MHVGASPRAGSAFGLTSDVGVWVGEGVECGMRDLGLGFWGARFEREGNGTNIMMNRLKR